MSSPHVVLPAAAGYAGPRVARVVAGSPRAHAGSVSARVARVQTEGGVALYVGGFSSGPTFCDLSCGSAYGTNAVVARVDWSGTALWAWVDGGTPGQQVVGAMAADELGCYTVYYSGAGYSWRMVAHSPSGEVRWNVACGTTSYLPSHIEVRDGYVYAQGNGIRDFWMLDRDNGNVVVHVAGYDETWDWNALKTYGYTGTVAAGDAGKAWIAQDWGPLFERHDAMRIGSGGIEADEGIWYDFAGWGGGNHYIQAVGMPGDGFGVWACIWFARDWVAAWSSGRTFATDEVVSYGLDAWVALRTTLNEQPDVSPTAWRMWEYGTDP